VSRSVFLRKSGVRSSAITVRVRLPESGQRLVSMEVFLVHLDPVGRHVALRSGQVKLPIADHLANVIFQDILYLRVPNGCCFGLRPQVVTENRCG
jgi:hypothetical protein